MPSPGSAFRTRSMRWPASSVPSATQTWPAWMAFAVGAGDGAGVEVGAPDHDRGLPLSRGDHLVEAQAGQVPLAVPEPADPRRQAPEGDALGAELDPPRDVLLVAE